MKTEIRLSGSGGQGLILAGIILGEAAILSNLNAVQTQSYGPEARGGASKAEVIISKGEINFPKVRKADLLLSLTQKSFNEYGHNIKDTGILVLDESIEIEDRVSECNVIYAPIIKTARDVIGKEMVANIVALGIISQLVDDIEEEKLQEAILARVPKGTEELNMRAFKEGQSLVRELDLVTA